MYRRATPLLVVDSEEEAAIVMERVCRRKAGRYFLPEWKCPTVPGDTVAKQSEVDPTFRRQLDESAQLVPAMVNRLNQEYQHLKRTLKDLQEAA